MIAKVHACDAVKYICIFKQVYVLPYLKTWHMCVNTVNLLYMIIYYNDISSLQSSYIATYANVNLAVNQLYTKYFSHITFLKIVQSVQGVLCY